MKISSIQYKTSTNFKTSQKKNFYSSQNIQKDILDINFTSKKIPGASKKFEETIQSDFIRNRIINEVIKDKNGKYNSETEEIFLDTYLDIYDAYIEDGEEPTEEFKLNLQEATLGTFKAIKREDGTLNLTQNVPSLIITALSAIEYEVYDFEEIFNFCKDENGNINEPLAESICANRSLYPNIDNWKMFYMYENFFTDQKTRVVNAEIIPMLLDFFSFAKADGLAEANILFNMITNEDRELDYKRYDFVYSSIEKLRKIVDQEVNDKSKIEENKAITGMIYLIINTIINSTVAQNKEFNSEKAEQVLDDFYEATKRTNILYKNEGLNPTPLKIYTEYNASGKTSVYGTSLYKLFNILCT